MASPLGYVYSRADALKRQLYDMITNPRDYASMLGGRIVEGGQEREALMNQAFADPTNPLKITNEKALAALTDKIMQGEMGITPLGITAYHGSPYLFKQFDPNVNPLGKKRNAYGYGVGYTSESKDVGNLFKENTSGWIGSEGYLYKGDIPDNLVKNFLVWDKPIKEQTKNVRDLAEKYGVNESDLGGDLVSKVGKNKEGTQVMLDSGITGIEYKKFGDSPNNYVVFRPEDFKIQEINDMPISDWISKGLLVP